MQAFLASALAGNCVKKQTNNKGKKNKRCSNIVYQKAKMERAKVQTGRETAGRPKSLPRGPLPLLSASYTALPSGGPTAQCLQRHSVGPFL